MVRERPRSTTGVAGAVGMYDLDAPVAVELEIPGQRHRSSWAYLIKDEHGSVHLIDCGGDSPENRMRLGAALDRMGRGLCDVGSVTVTHAHLDHAGLAGWLQQSAGAEVRMHALEARALREGLTQGGPDLGRTLDRWRVPAARRAELMAAGLRRVASGPNVDADVLLADGDLLEVPGRRLRVLSTPGHTPGHVCVVDDVDGTAWVGDHVLPLQFPGAGLGGPTVDNPIATYLGSVDRLAAVRATRLFPGHGPVVDDPPALLDAVRAHHVRRWREVAAAATAEAPVWQVAASIPWKHGWHRLEGVYLFSALRQVEAYLSLGLLGSPLSEGDGDA